MSNLDKFSSKEKDLLKRMHKFRIFEHDIHESFTKASGPGGQNVNKVSTCVILEHIPTGITVKCQAERSQALNRQTAKYLLIEKIEQYYQARKDEARYWLEKNRRKNRKRTFMQKEIMLEKKRIMSKKKSLRKKIETNKLDEYL